ncbi:MAG: efflux RND transporter periplasmic adaptor subunit [Acidiferrobacterales bacterium]
MAKRMLIMLVLVGLLFGAIFGFLAFRTYMIKKYLATLKAPPATVTTLKAEVEPWQPQLNVVGSLRAVRGVDVTSEIAGLVRGMYFKSGGQVRAGQLLVQLNADADIALLHSLEAAAELARTTYDRDKAQYEAQAISKAALDIAQSDLKVKQAQDAEQAALVDKKAIRAPFAGRLGISTINLGQYVNPGDKIVTLQSTDPVYADFYVPQQQLARIALGQKVVVTTDTYPGQKFDGKITAINPKVESDSRNVLVEATVANHKHKLLPGMYASMEVDAGAVQHFLTLPQTAVAFNPYGDTVFIVEHNGKGADGKPLLTVKQTFVTVGDTRGDQVAVLDGVKQGDLVVASGQLKLKNGSVVIINNRVLPSNDAAPKPIDQ